MSHGHIKIDPKELDKKFEFDGGLRKNLLILIVAGLVLFGIGLGVAISSEDATQKKVAEYAAGHGHGHDDHGAGHGDAHHEAGHGEEHKGGDHSGAGSRGEEGAHDATEGGVEEGGAEEESGMEEDGAMEEEEAVEPVGAADAASIIHKTSAGGGHGGDGDHAAAAGGHHDPLAHSKPFWLARLFSNLLIDSFFLMGLGAIAVLFLAVQYAANAGWYVQLHRIPEAMGWMMIPGMILLLIVFFAGGHHLYHWTDAETVANDHLLQHKEGYLNTPFFLGRNIIAFAIWVMFFFWLRNASLKEDKLGGIKSYNKKVVLSAVFVIVFALTFSVSAWDWIMSVEAHWFSTMFAVRMFSNLWVSAIALITLTAMYLKSKGYLPYLNKSHFHDLGKFMFGFSIFWTYIWFCEFLLIWYANIPEEGFYFVNRLDMYPAMFFTNFVLNFIIPFTILLHKSNMRNLTVLGFVACVIIIGHWIDLYMCVFPGVLKHPLLGNIGLMEIGLFLTVIGIFLYGTANFLTKSPLIPRKHPYLAESLLHQYS